MSSTSSTVQIAQKATLAPVITITPASLTFLPTPPLTPSSPRGIHMPSVPITPSLATASPPLPALSPDQHSLHYPLSRHLALMHPNTPKEVIRFVATRLLSTDRPHGHDGEWEPIWQGCGDLSTAGVGRDAGKGCKRKEGGEGAEVDKKLEEMYVVARESWRVLEMKMPGVGKI